MMDNDKDIDVDSQGIRHLGMSPCASENLTVLELDNCPLVTDASLEQLTALRAGNSTAKFLQQGSAQKLQTIQETAISDSFAEIFR